LKKLAPGFFLQLKEELRELQLQGKQVQEEQAEALSSSHKSWSIGKVIIVWRTYNAPRATLVKGRNFHVKKIGTQNGQWAFVTPGSLPSGKRQTCNLCLLVKVSSISLPNIFSIGTCHR
jgi:hypothetical protein